LAVEHLHYSKKVRDLLIENGLGNVKIFAGGIIPPPM